MGKRLKNLLCKYRELVIYLVFGVLTTLVNYLVFFPLYNYIGLSGALSNGIAWGIAVVFAYITNKPFVYKSKDWSAKTVLPEFGKFIGYRFGSGLLETAGIWLFVDIWHFNGNIIKIIAACFVVTINYLAGKILFKK